jgi:membrane protein
LAFYTILSLSPLLIIVVSIVALLFDRSTVQSHILSQVQGMIGAEGGRAVQSMLENTQKPSSGITASVIGILTLLFGASGAFGELRSALNKIWDVQAKNDSGLAAMLRERFFSFGMVLSIGFLLMASLLFSAGLAAIGKFFSGLLPMASPFLSGLDFLVSFVGIAALFALIFKFVPETKVDWGDVRVGAIATALLFTIGKTLIGVYLGRASFGSAYGAAGSMIVVIVWVYYSAQIFFFGAEFTHNHALLQECATKALSRP